MIFETQACPCVVEKELVEREKLKTEREIKIVDQGAWGEEATVP